MRTTTSGLIGLLLCGSVACAGSHPPPPIEEVPINQDPSVSGMDDDSSGGGTTDDHGGTGDHTVDTTAHHDKDAGADETPDAGETATTFKHHAGGLTLKQCTDMVMHLAKLTAKETKKKAPREKDLAQHPIYGQMVVQCGDETTKKQYHCAARAHSSSAWRKCMK